MNFCENEYAKTHDHPVEWSAFRVVYPLPPSYLLLCGLTLDWRLVLGIAPTNLVVCGQDDVGKLQNLGCVVGIDTCACTVPHNHKSGIRMQLNLSCPLGNQSRASNKERSFAILVIVSPSVDNICKH